MSFVVLDDKNIENINKWNLLIEDYFDGEPMAMPAYMQLFCEEDEYPIAFFYENDQGKVLYPVIFRKIYDTGYYDTISVYGYGGPYVCGNVSESEWHNFWRRTELYFLNNRVITEVIKFGLFFDRNYYPGNYESVMKNVVCDLNPSIETIFQSFNRKVRKNVRKAESYGLKILIEENLNHIEDFKRIYYSTMHRRQAEQKFYFDDNFFETIKNKMPEKYVLFYVYYNDKVIATELVLKSQKILYSYLGGTDEDYYYMRPNDFIKTEIIKWGNANKYSYFVLGGGHGSEDGIYTYKKSFAPKGIYDFKIGTRMFDSEIYDELCKQYNQNGEDNFIPAYRR